MKIKKLLLPVFVIAFTLGSCTKDDIEPNKPTPGTETGEEEEEEEVVRNLDVENFIWEGMNFWYLYKENVPELADDHFSSQPELDAFLKTFKDPEDLFYEGLMDTKSDRFSFLVNDYVELEKNFSGVYTTTGVDYGLSYISQSSKDIIGYVRYVAENSPASTTGIKRGDVFTKVDGTTLTDSNYNQLLAPSSFTLHLAEIKNGTITETGETITLTKAEFLENPILVSKVIETGGKKIGYLMYNSFTADFDSELNAAFADFRSQNVTDLVLDLRYNGGGNVETAVDLASMITGQYKGEIFLKKQFNPLIQYLYERDLPEYIVDKFNSEIRTGEAINSLKLNQVYIIATGSSASASELMINSLASYIDVQHIGSKTVGKFQASTTLYDSPQLTNKNNINKTHNYAIQPLIFKSSNADGVSDFVNGLTPDIQVVEYVDEYGPLGDPSEPLLAAAIAAISGQKVRISNDKPAPILVGESGDDLPTFQRMYSEELPQLIK